MHFAIHSGTGNTYFTMFGTILMKSVNNIQINKIYPNNQQLHCEHVSPTIYIYQKCYTCSCNDQTRIHGMLNLEYVECTPVPRAFCRYPRMCVLCALQPESAGLTLVACHTQTSAPRLQTNRPACCTPSGMLQHIITG